MNVSIVIPVYNALTLAKQCVQSIYEHGSALTFEIIVVDNGSAPDVEQWLLEEERTHANLRYMRYEEPLGFARSVNAGADVATGDVLIILNSDTLVTPGWMDELHGVLMADLTLGALTPATNHSGEPAQMDYGTVDLPATKAIATFARCTARQKKPPSTLYLPQRLTFFCVALRRSVWLEFNGLDEDFRVGNYEDDDLCLRLRVSGYRLGVARHVFVYHHNNATFSANKISHSGWMTQNAARFAEHARLTAEAADGSVLLRWPKRFVQDLSVIILPDTAGSLDRTLLSLANQTIQGFETILPGQQGEPKGQWIAYITQGDILYPFHLEALLDAMKRNNTEAIFADGWVHGAIAPGPHPDTATHIRKAPLLLSGWVHHASLHPDLLWEECVPMHWPRLTWEMQHAPTLVSQPQQEKPAKLSLIDRVRRTYRKLVPYETRLQLDQSVRRLIRRPRPDPDKLLLDELTAQLEVMLANHVDAGIFATASELPVVFLFNSISWAALTQRQHHFARGLAERGHTVFWVEPTLSPLRNWRTSRPLQQVAPGIFLLRLPALARDIYHMEWNEAILDSILDTMSAALRQTASAYAVLNAVALVNYPRWQPLLTHMHEYFGWKIVNDCLDDNRAFSDLYQTVTSSFEGRLVDSADRLITSSLVLQRRLLPRSSLLLHNAADFDLFSSATPAGHLQHLSRPIVGFFGALADWLDMPLIHDAAKHFPEWSFVYIGPHTFSQSEIEVEWLRYTDVANVTVLPQMDPRTLAAHLAEFDICIMPFRDIPATRTMNPVKLYEYLAAGKPTISRDLPEVRHLIESGADGLITLFTTPQQFFDCLKVALANDTPTLHDRRKAFARDNDWSQRVDQLSTLIVEVAKEVTTE
jgi:GT2 family glycosyltransferase/glycosyltransferase involved in cell wall biosynthesis